MRTRITELFDIAHPVVLGGMGTGTDPALVAGVSAAGGLGVLGCARPPVARIPELAAEIRERTDRPFGLNLLLFLAEPERVDAALAARPAVLSTAWATADADLPGLFARAHDAGCTVMHMSSTVDDAERAVAAGADAVVAQGTEGGGHVGLIGTMALVPMVVRAVAPTPVIAAGGLADGAGLAAAFMLGAEGALYGTRFLATPEAPLPDAFKQAIVDSDGHDTALTEIPDVAAGTVWPGAYARVRRNRFVERWTGREGELRYRQAEVAEGLRAAARAGDVDNAVVYTGQSCGLIDSIEPVADAVARIVEEAERLLREGARR